MDTAIDVVEVYGCCTHSRKRSNVFGDASKVSDARFRFLPKPNQIYPILPKFYLNLSKVYPNLLRDAAASPAPTPLAAPHHNTCFI